MVIIKRSIFGIFSNRTKKLFENPKVRYAVPLIAKDILNHDTRKFRFGLPSKDMVLGMSVCQHVVISAIIDDKIVSRAYTPITSDNDCGYVDIIIKIYFKGVNPKFPEGGKMTQYLECLKIGDRIEIQGPFGRVQYLDHGQFSIKKFSTEPPMIVHTKKVNMIAGGTGIAPILQFIRHIENCPDDQPQCALLFANKAEKDILMRDELERIAENIPDIFKLWYTLDKVEGCWKYSRGYITPQMLECHLYPPSNDTIVFMCGPSPMIKNACIPSLEKVGHCRDMCLRL